MIGTASIGLLSLNRLPPLEGLQAPPPESLAEFSPAGTDPSHGVKHRKFADRSRLGRGVFDEVVEQHDRLRSPTVNFES